MTLLFFIIQSSFAIGGAIVVLFARKRKHAFWGWIAVLLTAVTLILPHHSETPWVVPLFLCSGGITGWLTLKDARRFDREPTQPRSLHLGISRIFLLLLTLYFLFSVGPLWSSFVPNVHLPTNASHPDVGWEWVVGASAVILLSLLGMLPLLFAKEENA